MSNLDTTSKRRSSCQVLQPWQLTPPAPDGSFNAGDREHIAHAYSGIVPQNLIGTLSHNLSLQDFVTNILDYPRSISHSLTLFETVTGAVQANDLVTNLVLTESVTTELVGLQHLDQSLDFQESVLGQTTITDLQLQHTLYIDEVVETDITNQSYSLSTTLDLRDEVHVVLPQQNLVHTLTWTELAQSSLGLSTNLSIAETVIVDQTKGLEHSLNIQDSAFINHDRNKSLLTTLSIVDSVIAYTEKNIDLCHYKPESSEISTVVPTYSKISTITLTYPYISPSVTLALRNPKFENSERDSYNRIIRESRNGTLKVFRSTTWPKNKRIAYEVTFNKNQRVQDFLDFVNTSLGQEIGLLDYLNRQWKGILIVPENIFTHISRSNRQLSFDFEGELV